MSVRGRSSSRAAAGSVFGPRHGAGLAYERSLYSETTRNWPDLRGGTPDRFMVAWCHGAAGVGLGRLGSLASIDDARARREIADAVETTLQFGSGGNHALCHGDWGNLDLLIGAAQALGESRWACEARRWAAGLLDAAAANGWQCATPFGLETAGLMTGLAGMGYGLLRVASPERVPSVLAHDTP